MPARRSADLSYEFSYWSSNYVAYFVQTKSMVHYYSPNATTIHVFIQYYSGVLLFLFAAENDVSIAKFGPMTAQNTCVQTSTVVCVAH